MLKHSQLVGQTRPLFLKLPVLAGILLHSMLQGVFFSMIFPHRVVQLKCLGLSYDFIIKGRASICGLNHLLLVSIIYRMVLVRRVLWFIWCRMDVFLSEIQYLAIHSCPTCLLVIVPLYINTGMFLAFSIFGYVVVFEGCG